MGDFLRPLHRRIMLAIALAIVGSCVWLLNWEWLPKYMPVILSGIWITAWMTVVTMVLGMVCAVLLGIAQAAGPVWLAWPAKAYCTVIRGTPLLLQLWLLYFGLGSFFPLFPEIRQSFLWPILRQAWPYAVLALTMSVAGYEGEVMRGAFKGVPHGQLEAAKAMGMPRFTAFRRIWLPQAVHRALPTIGGETVLQMKSTPLIATISIFDIYGVARRITQDTLIVYEPLLMLAVVYMTMAGIIVLFFRWLESRLPTRTA
ncbi:MAG: ABC transporter permease [Proteobacteria bacterium]|nr:ABC transporter permease [Pseudomonadota bacterium]MBS0573594.1 ABC transporter permease [Pseudomonadota bacterium]